MIEFKNVSKHFGPTQVLHNIDLNIAQGEVVVIIGPSGSGKSTLLRCINRYGVPAVLPLPASDSAGKRHVWPATRAWREQRRGGKTGT